MLYEEMLVFGRRVQESPTPTSAEAKTVLPDQEDVRMPADEADRAQQNRDIADSIQMALELLGSGAEYSDALTRVIKALHRTMKVSGARKVETEDDRFQMMEKRLTQLEIVLLRKSPRKR
jgi:hypothetical protein